MSIARFSITKSVTTTMIFVAIFLFGAVSLERLPQELFPPISYPQLTVVTTYENAAPEEIETLITKPIEEVVGTVSGLRRIRSNSKEGLSLVIAEFGWDENMDFAALGVREKIDLIKERLPRECEEPIVMKFNPFDLPILSLSVTGQGSLVELRQLSEDVIKDELEKVDGVASASISGGIEKEILIEVDQGRLQAAGLSVIDITRSVKDANLNYPGGTIKESFYEYLIRTLGEFKEIPEISEVPVGIDEQSEEGDEEQQMLAEKKGETEKRLIKIKDIGIVKESFKERTSFSRYNGVENISISVQKQAQANTMQVVNMVKKSLANMKKEQLPKDVSIEIIYDQSKFIKEAINGVTDNAWQGGLLAFLTLLFFLRDIKSALIVTVSIPFSVICVFPLMFFSGISINLMSLGGLALGVGMLVDAAIVVIDNIFRHRQEGRDPMEAAEKGATEVIAAITSSVLTTIAVFFPMIFVIGIAGQIFKQLSFTITFSLLGSLYVAMTLIPLLASRMGAGKGQLVKPKAKFLVVLEDLFGKLLVVFLTHKVRNLFLVFVILLLSIGSLMLIDRELMPKVDQGQFMMKIDMPAGTKLAVTNRVTERIEECIEAMPEVKILSSIVGSTKGTTGKDVLQRLGTNQGEVSITLKPDRKKTSLAMIEEIKDVLKRLNIEGASVAYILQGSILSTGFEESAPVTVEVKGENLATIERLTREIQHKLSGIKGVTTVENNLAEPAPEVKVGIDKDKAATYSLSVADIAQASQIAIKGYVPTKFKKGGKETDIRIQFREKDRDSFSKLENILIRSPLGMQVPLSELAHFTRGLGPSDIKRVSQQRTALVFAQIYKRPLKDVTSDIDTVIKSMDVPGDYSVKLAGESEEMQKSFDSLTFALVLSIILVYMIMAAQFESLWQPFVIMVTVPLQMIGVAFGLWISHTTINVIALLGVIMLGGIVVDNGIVLIDYVNLLVKEEGLDLYSALIKGTKTRLRPILMTAGTTVMGLAPMAFSMSEGAELQKPMAVVVMYGLVVCTFFTLVVLPATFLLSDEIMSKFRKKKT